MAEFDLVIRGGTVATSEARLGADLGIREGRVTALGRGLGQGREEIDATGLLVLPGGVDTHCHIEQISGAGVMNADTFETATRSAAFGGTTSVVSFAAQHPGQRIAEVVADYAARAERGALVDHAFHMIVSDISGGALGDIGRLIEDGHRSIKIFTTYPKVRLDDEAILDVLATAREHGALVCFHAENDGLIRWATKRLLAEGRTAPKHHALSHPRAAEAEALHRVCRFAEATGQPVMLFHVSTRDGVEIVRAARARGAPVFAETCPHYLFQTSEVLDAPGMEGAAFMCSPPQRETADAEALWHALALGDLHLVSSDHAPYRMDETGKFRHSRDASFDRIANGMPGLETRLPLLFDAMVTQGRLGLEEFVRLTASAPARLFGLRGKGSLLPGHDADLALWDPNLTRTMGPDDLHDNVGYNPYAGRRVTGWPVCVISRGAVVIRDDRLVAEPGRGRRIPMDRAPSMTPTPPDVG